MTSVNEIITHAITNSKTKLPRQGDEFWKGAQLTATVRKQQKVDKAKARQEAKLAGNVPVIANRRPCECGCGQLPSGRKSRFIPGHDGRLKGLLLTAAKLGDEESIQRMIDLGWGRFLPNQED